MQFNKSDLTNRKEKKFVVEEDNLVEENSPRLPLCVRTSPPAIVTFPDADDESLGMKSRMRQTFKLSRSSSVRGAWMAVSVRDWSGPSFGDITSPVSDSIASAMCVRPIRRWQNTTHMSSFADPPPSLRPAQVRPIRNHQGLSEKTPRGGLKDLDDGRRGCTQNQSSKIAQGPEAVRKGLAFKTRGTNDQGKELADLMIVNNKLKSADQTTSKQSKARAKLSQFQTEELLRDDLEFSQDTSDKDEVDLAAGPDKLQSQYNSFKQPGLRQLFLSSNNEVDGRYFATILKKVVNQLEASRYIMAEMKLVLQCRSQNDWHKLADWTSIHQLESMNVRWLIEIPQLYGIYKRNGLMESFHEFLTNIFQPLFAVSVDPESDPKLANFLSSVTGFNLIADEMVLNRAVLKKSDPSPEDWRTSVNPSDGYYVYYIYANMVSLNRLRREKGYNTFSLRPHCVGSVQQLTTAFMTSDSIAHISTVLSKAPVLMYLFYLAHVGITTSVVTTAKASKRTLDRNSEPLICYLNCGLFASLSTYQPLRTHWTSEPLVEEQRIAANLLKLSQTDLCELSRNSLLISGFSIHDKKKWLGNNFERDGPAGNNIQRTGLSNIRVAFRFETFVEELSMVMQSLKTSVVE